MKQIEGAPVLETETDKALGRVLEFVVGTARELGIDMDHLVFTWDRKPLILQEYGLALNDDIYHLTIGMGTLSRTLTFSKPAILASISNSAQFQSSTKDYVMGLLRRLRSAATLMTAQSSSESRSSRK